MYCSNCGKEISENDNFCPDCGSENKGISGENIDSKNSNSDNNQYNSGNGSSYFDKRNTSNDPRF